MSGFTTERKESRMNAVAEASWHMRSIAGEPLRPVDRAIYRAWTKVRSVMVREKMQPIILSRAEDIWRKEVRRIDSEEMDAIRLAALEAQRNKENEETARFIARLSRQRAAMLAVDPEMHGEEAEALRRAIAALSRSARFDALGLDASPEKGGA